MTQATKIETAGTAEADRGGSELIDLVGGRLEVVARLGEGEDDAVLFRGGVAPGRGVPLHAHVDPECFYVLGGRLEVFLDDGAPGWRSIEAGGCVVVLDGVRHAIRNPGAEVAEILVVTNGRLARFFREAGRPAIPGTPVAAPTAEDFERIARVAQAYDYRLASPQEHAAVTG